MGKPTGINEIIDNDFLLKKKKSMSLKSLSMKKSRPKLCSDAEAESGADRYVRMLNAPECRLFFLKVMYHLPYEERERICEEALKDGVRSPKRYFTYCAKRALSRFGR